MPGEAKSKDEPDYKEKCRTLKRKLRFLVHEQECFQEELRKAQRKLLKVSRDKNFLLDRLLQYEKVIFSGSDSEPTDSSEDEKEAKKVPVTEPKIIPPEKPKVKRKPKKKAAKKLQADPKLGPGKTVLPIQLQSPPSSLKQHMPQLVEMLNRAAATSVGPVSPDTFAGLPYTPAYALPHLQNPGSLAQVYEQLPPSTTSSVLPSLLMSPHQFPRLGMMRNLPVSLDTPPRKKVRKESGKSNQSNHSKVPKTEPQPPPSIPKPPEGLSQPNGSIKDTNPK
ncbi:putative INO80 complex subunit E [Apostichopus japonicus]|uniref:Putative INO80 complex subunit E n=1 Tax=Stichopus japonicus TaxID=307972 RepID=A0A2G8L0S3_STIJA|nr:putative INO80 complex subunit E [Apostichopus japonicus]